MYKNLGESLFQYAIRTKKHLVLVTPFIKESVLSQIFNNAADSINLTVVTRWIPEEVTGGISDIEIWNLIKNRKRSQLFLCQNLHAKYYRFDDICLVGSANLTNQALGFKEKSNLELLILCSFSEQSLKNFEAELLYQSFPVTQDIYETYQNFLRNIDINFDLKILNDFPVFRVNSLWIPSLRNPQELYLAYSDQWERLTTTGKQLAKQELQSFSIVKELSEKNFNLYIALALKQTTIVQFIDKYLNEPRRFGEMKKFIDDFLIKENINLEPSHTWQTLMRWLLYFLPDCYSYKVFNYSEVFYRCKG